MEAPSPTWRSRPTRRLQAWVASCAAGLVAAVLSGRAELAAIAAPFGVMAATFARWQPPRTVTMTPLLDVDRVVEGDEALLTVRVGSAERIHRLSVRVLLSPLANAVPDRAVWATAIRPGEQSLLATLRFDRWGSHQIGPIYVRAEDRFGLVTHEALVDWGSAVRVLPAVASMRRLPPLRTRATFGSQVERVVGSGVEFAEIRAFQPGDSARSLNWRVSARRGTPHVNQRHAERNADVIVLLDTFANQRAHVEAAHTSTELAPPTFAVGVRLAGSLAATYLAARDRVGLVLYGGTVEWILPSGGRRALDRIVDRLLSVRVLPSMVDRQIMTLPKTVLPPRALVVALTPLHDHRIVDAVVGLRRHGHDVLVVRLTGPPRDAPQVVSPQSLARRLWALELDDRQRTLEGIGVVVVPCESAEHLDMALLVAQDARRRTAS